MPRKNKTDILKYLLLGLILFVTAAAIVSAEQTIDIEQYSSTYDFYTGAYTAQPQLCLCGTTIDKIIIKNTGQFAAVFTITTNSEYATLPFSTIKLDAGQSVDVAILLQAPCDAGQEITAYEVKIRSNLGKEKTITRQLEIKKCQNLNAQLFTDKTSIKPCVPVNYTVLIENTGLFTEEYTVEAKTNSQFYDEPVQQVTLIPGQKGAISMIERLSCDFFGNTTNTFEVTARRNQLKTTLSHELQSEWAYSFGIYIQDNQKSCVSEATTIPVKITNTADYDNTFKLSLRGAPAFIGLDAEGVYIPAKESKTVNILVYDKKKAGDYGFELYVEGRGNGKIEQYIKLKVEDCYNFYVNIESDDNPSICSGFRRYPVNVENNGLYEETIRLSVDAQYTSLSETEFKLAPGKVKEVELVLNISDEIENITLPTKVTLTLAGKQTTLSWGDSITFNAYSPYLCNKAEIEDKIYARYSDNATTLKIKNTGIRDTNYRIVYNGSGFIRVEQRNITVAAGKEEILNLRLYNDNSNPQNSYDFTITAVSFMNGQRYEESVVLVMTETPLIERLWAYITSSPCHLATPILILLILAAIIFWIVRIATKKDRILAPDTLTRTLMLGLIALIVLFVLFGFGMPKSIYPEINNVDKSELKMYEDGSYTINLNDYFNDPDNDTLIFTLEDYPDNLTIAQKGNIATFIPDKGWFGTRRIRYTATDESGSNVTSPRITIEVVDVPSYSVLQLYERYCVYFNGLLLVLFIEIVYFILITGKVRKARKGKVLKAGVSKEPGFLYYVDEDGDIARSPMKRGSRKAKKRK